MTRIFSEYNAIKRIYFFFHSKEYHEQIVHYSRSEISNKLKIVQELQDQIIHLYLDLGTDQYLLVTPSILLTVNNLIKTSRFF